MGEEPGLLFRSQKHSKGSPYGKGIKRRGFPPLPFLLATGARKDLNAHWLKFWYEVFASISFLFDRRTGSSCEKR